MKWQFPHTIGIMDEKHVSLKSPINSGYDCDNYKQFLSIVLFALVDADYKFLYVYVGSKGQISDGIVFKNSSLHRRIDRRKLRIPSARILQTPYRIEVPYFILGDTAVSLNKYTDIPDRNSKERICNSRLSRARRVVENAFGILSAVYRVLRESIL